MCSILWLTNILFCICTTTSLSIQWASRWLPCSTYCKQCCSKQWDTCVFFNPGFLSGIIYLGVGLLGHMVVLLPVFKGISIPSPIVAVSIYIPSNSARAFPFLYTLFSIYVCRLFDEGHSDQCEVISHCSFDLRFSNNERC